MAKDGIEKGNIMEQISKKAMSAALACLLAAGILAGCASDNDKKDPSSPASGGQVSSTEDSSSEASTESAVLTPVDSEGDLAVVQEENLSLMGLTFTPPSNWKKDNYTLVVNPSDTLTVSVDPDPGAEGSSEEELDSSFPMESSAESSQSIRTLRILFRGREDVPFAVIRLIPKDFWEEAASKSDQDGDVILERDNMVYWMQAPKDAILSDKRELDIYQQMSLSVQELASCFSLMDAVTKTYTIGDGTTMNTYELVPEKGESLIASKQPWTLVSLSDGVLAGDVVQVSYIGRPDGDGLITQISSASK